MDTGCGALFRRSIDITSPTSARITGPSKPRCFSESGRTFSVLKLESAYWTKRDFLYVPPIRELVLPKYFSDMLQQISYIFFLYKYLIQWVSHSCHKWGGQIYNRFQINCKQKIRLRWKYLEGMSFNGIGRKPQTTHETVLKGKLTRMNEWFLIKISKTYNSTF